MYTQKMHEVQKYTTLSDHGYIGYVVVVNKKFWDGLPADVRTQLDKAMAEATKYANDISEKENAEALEDMKKSGKTELITLTQAQKDAWKKALMPVYKDAEARVGKSLLDEFEKAKGTATH
jgi:C4-dicarboxylate-binding protein DctP